VSAETVIEVRNKGLAREWLEMELRLGNLLQSMIPYIALSWNSIGGIASGRI